MGDHEMDATFFEGVEKLLEVWFTRSDCKVGSCDLRKIPRKKIESLLAVVKCEIISFMSNDFLDAYVLSESSLFISKRRFILKTCGTTTPLLCLNPLLILVKKYAGFDEVEDVFYSRKNYKRPELQLLPHKNFENEVTALDSFFENGSAYCLGSMNRDCWYLYTANNCETVPMGLDGLMDPDQTLEVLMTDLDPDKMSVFYKDVCKSGKEATMRSGIDQIIPNAIINEHLFDPCGYSMNGIFKNSENGNNPDGNYMTIHITPEPEFSYVSFETNTTQESYKDLIARVVNTFQPGKFIVTIFANKESPMYNCRGEVDRLEKVNRDWVRLDNQLCRFKNYDLIYALYAKFPS